MEHSPVIATISITRTIVTKMKPRSVTGCVEAQINEMAVQGGRTSQRLIKMDKCY